MERYGLYPQYFGLNIKLHVQTRLPPKKHYTEMRLLLFSFRNFYAVCMVLPHYLRRRAISVLFKTFYGDFDNRR